MTPLSIYRLGDLNETHLQLLTLWTPLRTWVMKQMHQSSCLHPIKFSVGQIARKSANQVFLAMAEVIVLAPRDEVHDQQQALWLLQQRSEAPTSALLAITETRFMLQHHYVDARSTTSRHMSDPTRSAKNPPFSMHMLARTTRLMSLTCPWL